MKRMLILLLLTVTVGCSPTSQQSPPATSDTPSTAALDAVLHSAVTNKRVPYAAAMVANRDGITYEHEEGIAPDAIYAIASMTKAVTTIAAMQLVEAGEIALDEPASTYVPELDKTGVLDSGALRRPKSAITVRQLMSHTAGFGYEFMNRDLLDLVAAKKLPSVTAGGDGFLRAPLLFDPGTRWQYGISVDWLGRLVERVSGQSLEDYFRQHIFSQLGMSDTFFVVPADKRSRIAKQFARDPNGTLTEQPAPPPADPKAAVFYAGGGGLYSTARDYLTLTRTLMAGGQLGGARILTPASIAVMGRNQIGDFILHFGSVMPSVAVDGAMMVGDLDKFGLGFALNSKPSAAGRGANTMAWAGIYNTFYWIDREHQVTAVLMTQMLPFLDDGPARLLEDFDRAVYAWTRQ
jgi:CubicO group peptidase (beta-lactamase class C family)